MKAYASSVDRVWLQIQERREAIFEREMEYLTTRSEEEIRDTSEFLEKQTDKVSRKLAYRSRTMTILNVGLKAMVWLALLVAFVGFAGRRTLTSATLASLGTAAYAVLLLGVAAGLGSGLCSVMRSRYCEFLVKSVAVQQILEAEFGLLNDDLEDTNAFAVLSMAAFRFVFAGDDIAPYLDHEIIYDDPWDDGAGDKPEDEDEKSRS